MPVPAIATFTLKRFQFFCSPEAIMIRKIGLLNKWSSYTNNKGIDLMRGRESKINTYEGTEER